MPPSARDGPRPQAAAARRYSAEDDPALVDRRRHRPGNPAERARNLLLLGLVGAIAMLSWLRLLASEPHWPLAWQTTGDGSIVLRASTDPQLQALTGQALQALVSADGQAWPAGEALLQRSPRWIVDDAQRQQWHQLNEWLSRALEQASVTLRFDGAADQTLVPRARGLAGLGPMCWLLCALALALSLAGAVVVITGPGLPAWLYGAMAWSQSLALLLTSAESLPGMGMPAGWVQWNLPLRLLADAATAAALVHVVLIYPRRACAVRWLGGPVWALALGSTACAVAWSAPGLWWAAQALTVAYGLAAAHVLGRAGQGEPGPLSRRLRHLVLAGTCVYALLSAALAAAERAGRWDNPLTTYGALVWAVFFASLLLLGPFVSTSRQVRREYTVLASVSIVAMGWGLLSLHLLALDLIAALSLMLAATLAVHAVARPWIRGHLTGRVALSGERLFDSLYRAARALEQAPDDADRLLTTLLREVFDPQEVASSARPGTRVWVAADGSTLLVPVVRLFQPETEDLQTSPAGPVIVLRHAGRGRRRFTQHDRQLCERLLDQLRRAVAYDRAVEHGRAEERARIAQDLHDDIGARLLTLMYKAADPEIEAYIRHTLQDLKTLTRGLAASNHRLSHAAAEWKSDITQRLNATGSQLRWDFSADRDLTLTVVQWSGLTRILRELVNNIITHAQASQVQIHGHLDHGRLRLRVSDDGIGRSPAAWSHGLGLGGIRKRVKLLGGQVHWREHDGGGIQCEVDIPLAEAERGS